MDRELSEERYDAALNEFILQDSKGFAKAVGERQEIILRDNRNMHLDDAFALAVEAQLAA